MSEPRDIRDPVLGFIKLNGVEGEIVSSPNFQRLRRIRQLAFAHLVYPGALHTRFEHSLGVCHIAGKIATSLNLEDEPKKLVRLAALLHDIGHGPFSHVSEEILEVYHEKEKLQEPLGATEKIHEKITADIIIDDQYISKQTSHVERENIIKLLGLGYGDPMLRSIVSGPIDADKQDYLLRDSYFCGVKYGVFDIGQLHREIRVFNDPPEGKHLAISKDGIHALEQFVLAKYYITNQVYRHRIRLITDQMLIRAIILGIDEDQIDELRNLYTYNGNSEFVYNYLKWDDAKLLVTFSDKKLKGKYCCELLHRLLERRLLKRIFEKPIKDFPEICREPLLVISKPENKKQRTELEKHLWEKIYKEIKDKNCAKVTCVPESDYRYLVLYSYTIKSIRTQSRDDEASIIVERGSRGKSTFEEESALFNSIDEKLSEAFVEVYAPINYDTPVDRDKLLDSMQWVIIDSITSFFERTVEKNENA